MAWKLLRGKSILRIMISEIQIEDVGLLSFSVEPLPLERFRGGGTGRTEGGPSKARIPHYRPGFSRIQFPNTIFFSVAPNESSPVSGRRWVANGKRGRRRGEKEKELALMVGEEGGGGGGERVAEQRQPIFVHCGTFHRVLN